MTADPFAGPAGRWQQRDETSAWPMDSEHFFEALRHTIWHLNDWLKHDYRRSILTASAIEDFANNAPALMIVADLANETKHVQLSAGAPA